MKHSIPAGSRTAGFITAAGGSARRLPLTLLLLTIVLLLGGCAGRDIAEQPPVPAASLHPGLQHSGTQQQFHSFESAGLTFHFTITNPGPDTLQLHSYRYRLEQVGQASSSNFVPGSEPGSNSDVALDPDTALDPDRTPLASGRQELADRSVPAGGSTSLEVPIQLPLKKPLEAHASLSDDSSAPEGAIELSYTLSLEVLARSNSSTKSKAGENIQLTSDVNGTLPLPQLPQVQIPEVVITQFKTHTIDIEYKVEITNPNSFPLVLSSAEYTFSVRATVWDKGALPQGLQIPPESSRSVSKAIVFNYLKAGRKTVDTLISGKSIDYRITGAAAAVPEEQPSTNNSSESALEPGPAEPVPYNFSFELEKTAALIRP